MPHDQRYDCAYIFGAVCPGRDTGVALVVPDADIPAMNLHLKAISKHVQQDAHAVVLIDGAGWHKEGGNLRVPRNITLIRFPAYCPELNAQENVWEYLRPNFLAGKVFDTYNDIVEGCCVAWCELLATAGKIKSIASRHWLHCQQVIT
jgi:putative transposase